MSGLGFHPTTIARPRNKPEAIAAARTALARCQFDEQGCELGLRRLRAYRKEWDESRGVWKDHPRHDDASASQATRNGVSVTSVVGRVLPRVEP
jgi:hypothetical protein